MTCNILSFIRRLKRSGRTVEKIINKFQNSKPCKKYSAKKFYSYQYYLKENMTDFKGKDAIEVLITSVNPQCSCFTLKEQMFYNKVCRTLINYYVKQEMFVDILSSNRVISKNRKDYLKIKRYF